MLNIDRSYFNYTCDRIKIEDAFYSDKPPVLSLIYTAGLFLIQGIGGVAIPTDLPLIYQIMSFLFAGIPFCWIVFLLYNVSHRAQWPPLLGMALAILLPTCSQLFVFATTLNSHIVAASLLLWAWCRMQEHKREDVTWLILGFALTIDPLTVTFLLAWALFNIGIVLKKDRLLPIILGIAGPLLLHSLFCWLIASHPFALNLNPEHFIFEGSQHTSETLTGVGIKHSTLATLLFYAYNSIIGHHGFFIYNSVAIFGLLALRQNNRLTNANQGIIYSTLLLFFALTILFSNNHSGDAYGNRWHVLMVPMCLYGFFSLHLNEFKSIKIIAPILLSICIWGGFITQIGLKNPWTPNVSEAPSYIIQNTSEAPYATYELRRAKWFLEAGKFHEARAQGELALNRNPLHPEAWSIVVTSAIYRKDHRRLQYYSNKIRLLALPWPFKEDLLNALENAHQGP